MIDYHKGGNLMGVYGEGLGGFGTRSRPLTFRDEGLLSFADLPCRSP